MRAFLGSAPIAVDEGSGRIETAALPEGFTLLQVVPRLEAGGVEEASLDLARCAAAADARSLVASHGGALEARLAKDGAELVRLPLDAKDPITLAANALRLARVIQREGVSLVHVRSRAPAFSALAAARMTGVALIATYHGAYSASWAGKRGYNRVMTAGEAVIANSRFIAEHVRAQHPAAAAAGKIALIPEGVDVACFDPAAVSRDRVDAVRAGWDLAAEPDRPIVLLAARLAPIKGQLLAVEALARLEGEATPILVLAGSEGRAGQRAAIAAAAERLGVADRVRLPGPCADMPAAYLAADLVIAPSLVAESFGRSVVEAAAMGKSVLASALGALAETIVEGETGWLASPGDVGAWATALARGLAMSPQAQTRMGEAARERAVRLYSLETMCEATFALYRKVLEGRGWRQSPRRTP